MNRYSLFVAACLILLLVNVALAGEVIVKGLEDYPFQPKPHNFVPKVFSQDSPPAKAYDVIASLRSTQRDSLVPKAFYKKNSQQFLRKAREIGADGIYCRYISKKACWVINAIRYRNQRSYRHEPVVAVRPRGGDRSYNVSNVRMTPISHKCYPHKPESFHPKLVMKERPPETRCDQLAYLSFRDDSLVPEAEIYSMLPYFENRACFLGADAIYICPSYLWGYYVVIAVVYLGSDIYPYPPVVYPPAPYPPGEGYGNIGIFFQPQGQCPFPYSRPCTGTVQDFYEGDLPPQQYFVLGYLCVNRGSYFIPGQIIELRREELKEIACQRGGQALLIEHRDAGWVVMVIVFYPMGGDQGYQEGLPTPRGSGRWPPGVIID